ncbi:MAG: EAL domain-containing protein [Gammaproteobacteria bacterium]|nr:EAL domain-containing protein [Gammaproteobacteria bacterium]MDH4253683.1 EAL domain-containing protein [Gammaproteobacteria bacterium]MDH5310668.1 EAL domain-containing protein [Gammaproteobacteria bacterium]
MSAEVHNLEIRKNVGAAKGLLHSLVPRAQCFCFYGLERQCVWSSDGVEDYEIDDLVGDLPDEIVGGKDPEAACLKRSLTSGRTLLLLPVYGDAGKGIGLLVAVFSKNDGKSSWFNPSLLQNILMPAVAIIGESLTLGSQLGRAVKRCIAAEEELQLVYSVDEKIHGTSRSHSGLAQLVGQSGRFLGIAYSVLLMPGKRIRISATHSSWKTVNRKSVDRYLIEKLFPKLSGASAPVIFDIAPIAGSDHIVDQGYQAMLSPLFDRQGNLEGAIAQLGRVDGQTFTENHKRFMSHIVRKVEYVIEQSFDSMTGLMNRSGFEAQLHESGKALGRDANSHQIIYFDLDNLRLVNDTFGHAAGDQVIMRFAQILEDLLPKNAVGSRLTGDDFGILLTAGSTDEAVALAMKIKEACDDLRYLEGDRSLQVTSSVGVAAFERPGGEGDALTAARIACDSAKDHGRDRVEVYNRDDQSIVRRYDDMHIVAQIQQTLDNDGFELLAQPIVRMGKKKAAERYEILLRMNDGDGDRISSPALISAAERYQLMPQIDRWVISASLRKLSERAQLLRDTGMIFAINLSGQSLGDDEILTFILEEVANTGVPWSSLCFEVTESAAVSNRAKAQAFIDSLRQRGCRFALDDFGAGLSSFAYLKNFNIDTLKIDGGFVRDITDNRISESMVAAITQVAKVMQLETVAEYVETAKSKKLLGKLGVDFAQGHAVGKTVPLDDILAALADQPQSA